MRCERPRDLQRLYLYREQTVGGPFETERESAPALWGSPLVILAAHVPLALLMSEYRVIGTLHAWATFFFGLWLAASGRSAARVAYVAGYVVGAEVLWRMTGAQTPWEFGKYAAAAMFIVSMARAGRLRGPKLPFAYFALLLPSCALTLLAESWGEAREQISFNLSGPFALMTCALFFSQLRLSAAQLQRLRLALVAPVVGIAAIAISATLGTEVVFTGESNNMTSGGFGPNQVSSALGLGAMLLLFYVLQARAARVSRAALFVVMIVLATQCAMTFSRGGLYNAAGGALCGFLFLAKDARAALRIALVAALIAGAAVFYVVPKLDEFTGGAIVERFENTDSTNRDHIVEADLQIWEEHPLMGVGPGQGPAFRRAILYGAVSHTEFSRLFAEHGLLGCVSLALLLIAGVKVVFESSDARARSVKATGVAWGLLYMITAAMRLAAPSFLFGLAFAQLNFCERGEEGE